MLYEGEAEPNAGGARGKVNLNAENGKSLLLTYRNNAMMALTVFCVKIDFTRVSST